MNHSKGAELTKNTAIILLGKLCTQFLSFFLLPLYTAILDSDEFGIVDLVTTYISLIVPCITLQLESAAFRFLIDARNDDRKKRDVITNVIVFSCLLTVLCAFAYEIVGLFLDIPYKNYLLAIVIATISSNIVLQIARGLGDNIAYSIGSLIAGGCTILFNVLFLVVFSLGPKGMFLSLIIANSLCTLFVVIRCKIIYYISSSLVQRNAYKALLKYSIPLVPNSVIWWIINASDRTIIALFMGTTANGIYAVSNKFSNAVMSAYYVFNMSWTESTSLHLKEDNDNFISNTFQTMTILFSCLCLCIIGCMSFVFPIMVKGNYEDSYMYIPILMIGSVFNIIVGLIGAIYVSLKKTREIAVTSFWSGIINIVINVIFIKVIGLYAASLSTAVAFGIMAVYRFVDIQKYVKIKINISHAIIMILSYALSVFLYYWNNKLGNIVNAIFVIIISIYLNRSLIKNTFNKIRSMKHKTGDQQ